MLSGRSGIGYAPENVRALIQLSSINASVKTPLPPVLAFTFPWTRLANSAKPYQYRFGSIHAANRAWRDSGNKREAYLREPPMKWRNNGSPLARNIVCRTLAGVVPLLPYF